MTEPAAELSTPPTQPPDRGWWVKMLLWSAALIIFCLAACYAAYNGPLYYYAWKWRKINPGIVISDSDKVSPICASHFPDREAEDILQKAAKAVVARKMPPGQVVQLLGPPSEERTDPEGNKMVYYWIDPLRISGVGICFKHGGAASMTQARFPEGGFGYRAKRP